MLKYKIKYLLLIINLNSNLKKMNNYHSIVYNYISESNNAKIIYVTNQTNNCAASNILNSKNKVRKNINLFFNKK